jgi:hypothetical protein
MRTKIIRYRTTPARADENQRLIEAVFSELDRQRPWGVRYASFRLDDGTSFVHVLQLDDPDRNPLVALEAFDRFVAGIGDRCIEPAVACDSRAIGTYGFGPTA